MNDMPETRSAVEQNPVAPRGRERAGAGGSQFVAFTIGEQSYCVDIMAVREIRAWSGTTSLPNCAEFVRGVINLRGVIVPIIDLRTRFGLGETAPTKTNVIVVVAVGQRLYGLLVDTVSDILTVSEDDIMAMPETHGGARAGFLTGLLTVNDRMVARIGLDEVISGTQVQ